MSKVLIGSPHVQLDVDVLLRTRMLVQANSGKGKSWLLRRLAEQLFGKVQVIIIDPEGEFATLREKFGYVLVGKGGETPADPRSALLVAHKLLELRASAVCDLYEMKPATRHEWVRRFLEAIIDAPKNLWHPCVIMVDEAHVYMPEMGAGESEASEAMIGLATRGRKRGFGCIFATQRLGKLRKDGAAELLNVMIGGTFIDVDRKRAADALGFYGAEQHKFFDEIKVLERGKFFCLGPAISNERILATVGPVETTHPEGGSSKHSAEPPPAPEEIARLLPKLADLPKAAEEKAKTESELRSEIRSLKAQLRSAPTVTKEVRVADPKAIEGAARIAREHHIQSLKRARQLIVSLAVCPVAHFAERYDSAIASVDLEIEALNKISGAEIQRRESYTTNRIISEQTPRPNEIAESNGKLRAGAERMLAALVQWSPNGMAEGQMRSHAGLKKSGTFSTYLSDLRRGGYIEERGGEIFATEIGLEYCKHVAPAPATTEDVLNVWRPKLREGARRMLDALVQRGGEPMTKDDLGQEAGLAKSGTFSTYLSDLKTARLAVINRDGTVAANKDTLFL